MNEVEYKVIKAEAGSGCVIDGFTYKFIKYSLKIFQNVSHCQTIDHVGKTIVKLFRKIFFDTVLHSWTYFGEKYISVFLYYPMKSIIFLHLCSSLTCWLNLKWKKFCLICRIRNSANESVLSLIMLKISISRPETSVKIAVKELVY